MASTSIFRAAISIRRWRLPVQSKPSTFWPAAGVVISRGHEMPVLLLTGGGRGIGAGSVKLAAARGYDVGVNYKTDENSAAEVVAAAKASGRKALAIRADMGKEADI